VPDPIPVLPGEAQVDGEVVAAVEQAAVDAIANPLGLGCQDRFKPPKQLATIVGGDVLLAMVILA
jgi:hypothetical protein